MPTEQFQKVWSLIAEKISLQILIVLFCMFILDHSEKFDIRTIFKKKSKSFLRYSIFGTCLTQNLTKSKLVPKYTDRVMILAILFPSV
jgi:hypothetical protein